jgi:hypothetical protein
MCWIYLKNKNGSNYLYTVGVYLPKEYSDGSNGWDFQPVADFNKEFDARELVNFLNGGTKIEMVQQ